MHPSVSEAAYTRAPGYISSADGWLVLDARKDGWMLVVRRDCQTPAERERVQLPS